MNYQEVKEVNVGDIVVVDNGARHKVVATEWDKSGLNFKFEDGQVWPGHYVQRIWGKEELPTEYYQILAFNHKDDVDETCSSHIYPSYVSCMSVKGHLAKARSYELLANEPLMLQSNAHDGLKFIDARYAMDMLKRCKNSYPQKEFHIIKMDAQYFGRIHPRWVVTI